MSGYSWSWSSSSSGSCQNQTTRKVIQTSSGQRIITTTTSSQPQLVPAGTCGYSVVQSCNPQPVQSQSAASPALQSSPEQPKPSSNFNQFENDCLAEHNRLRALHGCPPLALDREICQYATEWANNIARRNTMQHRSNNKYGENIFMSGGGSVNGKTAVKAWYDEISDYNYSRPGFSSGTGHFTQVVWKNSKRLGVGVAKNGNNTYVVANYDPHGNFAGQFPNNVPRRI